MLPTALDARIATRDARRSWSWSAILAGGALAAALFASGNTSAQTMGDLQTATAATPAQLTGPIMLEATGSFFIGGQDEQSDGLAAAATATRGTSGTWTVDQMYVQFQRPYNASHLPMVLIHGCCLTGKTWETTPDGRMGWYEYFVRQGFPTYVIDQVARGRSGFDMTPINEVAQGIADPSHLPAIFSAGHESAWTIFRFGPQFPNAFPGLQFPIWTAAPEGQFWKQMVPDLNQSLPQPTPTVAALSQLAINLAGAILVSHSESGVFPFQSAHISTQGIAGIISIEPGACTNLDVAAVAKIPTLILYGDNVSQFANWATSLQACTAFVNQVNAAGGNAQVLQLPSLGILGNSHMLMQDKNNLQIAQLLIQWVQQNVETKTH
jgi:hypothetical protein